MRNGRCPKCGSTTIYAARSGVNYNVHQPYANVNLGNLGSDERVDFVTFLCASCGYFENYLADAALLAKVTTAKNWQKVAVQ